MEENNIVQNVIGRNLMFCDDCSKILSLLIHKGVKVDLTVTSPPIEYIKNYWFYEPWNFEKFKTVAMKLYEITKDGCMLVWITKDGVVNGGETGTSFKQALFFKDLGFKLHDTMIYEYTNLISMHGLRQHRYIQGFEYMFVFSKGKMRDDVTLLKDSLYLGKMYKGLFKNSNEKKYLRGNVWKYDAPVGVNGENSPSAFPVGLASDHILTWSKENEIVLDPFIGSGTTGLAAMQNNRRFIGIEINKAYYKNAVDRLSNQSKE